MILDIPLRDGIVTRADVYLPEDDEGGPWPAVLTRTPYGRELFAPMGPPLTTAGYAVVVQDVRGRGASEGVFTPYEQEGPDGFDSVEWVASQPWCDGQVALSGASYGGWTVWSAAREHPPHLTCAESSVACVRFTGEWPWQDGVLWPGAIAWLYMFRDRANATLEDLGDDLQRPVLPIASLLGRLAAGGPELEVATRWLEHPTPDAYWDTLTLTDEDFAGIDLPVLHVTGWFDGCLRSSHWLYEKMRALSPARERQALLVGAWDHAVGQAQRRYDGHDFGEANARPLMRERIAFFDHWMKGGVGGAPAPARVFVTGANGWREVEDFPDPQAQPLTLHLEPPGGALELSFRYDPADPVMTTDPDAPTGFPSLDRRRVHEREDVLVWTWDALAAPLELAGTAEATIWMSSDAPDTDLFVEVADEAPDGTRFLVAHGRHRLRWRDGIDRPARLLTPGVPEPVHVTLSPRAHRFAAGHRIVVAVTSSGAPLWAPNPNVADDPLAASTWRTARNTVHVGPSHPSRITLPVLTTEEPTP